MKAPVLEDKEVDEKFDSTSDLVEFLDNANPEMLFNALSLPFDPAYFDTANEIYTKIELPRGVLNAMILKAVKLLGEMPKFMYIKKMSNTWIEDNIFTTIDAVKYITEAKGYKPLSKDDDNDNGGFREL